MGDDNVLALLHVIERKLLLVVEGGEQVVMGLEGAFSYYGVVRSRVEGGHIVGDQHPKVPIFLSSCCLNHLW